MLTGLRTVVFTVPDLAAARAWYQELLGFGPYFDQPFYVGFSVGGCELGLVPAQGEAAPGIGGDVPYWGVADAPAALARLAELGATVLAGPQDVGGGIVLGHARDPFGNVLGVIDNPNFRAALGEAGAAPGDVSDRAIVHQVTLAAPPARVFALWTTSAGMASWWVPDCTLELSLGGRYELRFLDEMPRGLQGSEECRVLSWLPDRMLSFSWNAPPGMATRRRFTVVVLELQPVDGGTHLRLTHHGWPASGMADESSEWPATFAYFDAAWARVLARLQEHLGAP